MSEEKIADNLEKISATLMSIDAGIKQQNKKGFAYFLRYLHFFYAIVIIVMLFFADQDHINVSQMIQDSTELLNVAQN